MEQLVIETSGNLQGEIVSQGSKNSALPILAATVLISGKSIIHRCPHLTDVEAAIKILKYLGCKVEWQGDALLVDSSEINRCDVPENLMHEMRSSIVFLGPLLGRTGKADLSTPGGCEIGLRPIDLHIKSVRRFGVEIDEGFGKINCRVEERLKGCETVLPFPSVGATENAMLSACLADGTSVIINSAREPEIEDLADFLNKCGAKISGAGTGKIVVEGVKKLHGCEHTVIPDRIMVSTYLACCAVAGGEITIKDVCCDHISPTLNVILQSGCKLVCKNGNVHIKSDAVLKPLGTVRTMPYPGFPTDFQAPAMAMACVANGTSVIVENIFESRFKHASELVRMGANIKVEGRVCVVEGVKCLTGANVTSTDLRGGSALVVAGLCAQGTTVVRDLSHIDRGCEDFARTLNRLGAKIRREQIPDGER